MHEISLMQEVLHIAMMHAERNKAQHIHTLTLRIGPLAGVDVEALRLAFQVVTEGTAAAGAILEVEETNVKCWCAGCSKLFEPPHSEFFCPDCKVLSSDIRQGREFDVIALEVM
jgi:hydrogenase nickel incorporation protein HypA/HybF